MTEDDLPTERFDAFLSYARSVSTPLASELQTGIERFAKPWYRLRASRVFRDDSSMSANTALWSTIEKGLTDAGWLILLATPESAASEYVNKEVKWWVDHKDPSTILLVHAGGELAWDRDTGDFTSDSSSVPQALRSAYLEEPRWIDMRWFSEENSLGKADSRFAERVADLAAAVRGIERDTLLGDNVREHRKAIRLARVGVTALATLLVVSMVATVFAFVQRNAAEEQARIATARQLAATAQSLLATDISTARLLAVQGYTLHPDSQTKAALLAAVTTNPQVMRTFEASGAVTSTAASADGSTILAGTEGGDIIAWSTESGDQTVVGSLGAPVTALSVNEDGTVVAAVSDSGPLGLWTGRTQIPLPEDAMGELAVSPSGNTVGFTTAMDYESSQSFYGDNGFGTLTRSDSLAEYADSGARSSFSPFARQLVIPDDQTVIAWVDIEESGTVQHRSLPSFDLIASGEGSSGVPRDFIGTLSPRGDYLLQVLRGSYIVKGSGPSTLPLYASDRSVEYDEPQLVGYAPEAAIEAIAISAQADRIAVAAAGTIYVSTTQEPGAGIPEPVMLSGNGSINRDALTFLSDGSFISATGSTVTRWNPDATNQLVTTTTVRMSSPSSADGAPGIAVSPDGKSVIVSEVGSFTDPVQEGGGTVSWHDLEGAVSDNRVGAFLDWRDSSSAYLVDDDGIFLSDALFASESARWPVADLPRTESGSLAAVSAARYVPAERRLLLGTTDGVVSLDGATGSVTQRWPDVHAVGFSADGRYAVSTAEDAKGSGRYTVTVVTLSSGETRQLETAGLFGGVTYQSNILSVRGASNAITLYSGDGATVLGQGSGDYFSPIIPSPDGTITVQYSQDGTLLLSSRNDGLAIGRFDVGGEFGDKLSYGFSADGTRLIVAIPNFAFGQGSIVSIDLRPENWEALACDSVGRALTLAEWDRFTGQPAPEHLACG